MYSKNKNNKMLSFNKFKKLYKLERKNVNSNYIANKYAKGMNLFFGTEHGHVKKYRFYDDDPHNIAAVEKDNRIECILVPRRQMEDGTIGSQDVYDPHYIRNESNTKTYYEHLQKTYNLSNLKNRIDNKDLIKYIDTLSSSKDTDYNEKHVSESFDSEMMFDCRMWATELYDQEVNNGNTDDYYGAVFFDFDRVLNSIEGISITYTVEEMKSRHDVELSAVVKYIIGSPKRLQELRLFFGFLEFKKIRACILTNNGACGEREMFYDVCAAIHNSLKRENIFCCRRKINKLVCLYENNVLDEIKNEIKKRKRVSYDSEEDDNDSEEDDNNSDDSEDNNNSDSDEDHSTTNEEVVNDNLKISEIRDYFNLSKRRRR